MEMNIYNIEKLPDIWVCQTNLSISSVLNNLLIQVFERSGTPHRFVAVLLS